MDFNLKQLETLYWFLRLGSFQSVANHLNVTQPAVSIRISNLEEQMGAKLVDRDGPRYALTEQGYEIAAYAERFLALREEMSENLRLRSEERFSMGIVGLSLGNWTEAFRARLAEEENIGLFDFHYGSNHQLREQLESGSIDLAFLTLGHGLAEAPGEFSVRYKVGWVGGPNFAAAPGRVLTLEDVNAMPLILYRKSSPMHSPVYAALNGLPRKKGPRHYANSMPTLIEMLRRNYGVSALTLSAVEEDLDAGTLFRLPVEREPEPMEMRCYAIDKTRHAIASRVAQIAKLAADEWVEQHPRHFLPPDT